MYLYIEISDFGGLSVFIFIKTTLFRCIEIWEQRKNSVYKVSTTLTLLQQPELWPVFLNLSLLQEGKTIAEILRKHSALLHWKVFWQKELTICFIVLWGNFCYNIKTKVISCGLWRKPSWLSSRDFFFFFTGF